MVGIAHYLQYTRDVASVLALACSGLRNEEFPQRTMILNILQPVYFGGGTELGKTGAGVAGGGAGVASGIPAAGALAPIGVTSAAFAEVGSLSALATRSANCHI